VEPTDARRNRARRNRAVVFEAAIRIIEIELRRDLSRKDVSGAKIVNRSRVWLLAAVCGSGLLLLDCDKIPGAASAQEKPGTEGEFGTITGQFLLEGDIPKLKALVEKGDTKVNDAAICAAADVPDDTLIVDPKTKGIANIFVYLPKAGKIHSRLKESATKEVAFDQKDCRFVPHVLFVRTDQVVRVKSDDSCAHNTKTNTSRNDPVNYLLQAKDRTGREVKNKAPEKIPVKVECNIHRWMSAWWLILDHPYAAISDDKGKFTIADLPAGEVELIVWHERVGYVPTANGERRHKVMVVAGQTTELGTIQIPAATLLDAKSPEKKSPEKK
jgi:hypothetical protein